MNKPTIAYSELKDGRKGITVGEEDLFLWTERLSQNWRFKVLSLRENNKTLTTWVKAKRPEELRTRQSYLRQVLKDALGKNFEEGLEKIFIELENNEDQFKEEAPVSEQPQFAEEIERKAWTLLQDPAFFFKLGQVFEYGFMVPKINMVRFVIGEQRNKRLLPPLHIGSSKLGMTSIIKILGDPGTGKDSMERMTLELLSSVVKSVERSYVTAASLRYSKEMKDADLLYIPDSPELQGEMGRQLRFMRADDGGLISEYATRDAMTGEMTTKVSTLPVKAIATTSNALTVDPALESGMWELTTNASEDLTREVKEEKLKLRAGERPLFPEPELKVWQCAFKLLATKDLPDTLPKIRYAKQLVKLLESTRSESRRDPDKLCDLISLMAWVRRFQKQPEKRGEADLLDLYFALQIGLDAITQTISELDEKELTVYNAVRDLQNAREGAQKTLDQRTQENYGVTCREVAEKTQIPYKTCYSYLEKLLTRFINKEKDRGKNFYSLLSAKEPNTFLLSEGRNIDKPDKLMGFILRSIGGFSLSHEGTNIFLIDPLTAEKLTVKKDGENWLPTLEPPDPEIKNYPYPPEKVRSAERGEIHPSETEKKTETFLPLEKRKEIKPKSIDDMFQGKLEAIPETEQKITKLRSTITKGTQEDFQRTIIEVGLARDQSEAESLFNRFVADGKILRGDDGRFWQWA